MKYLTGSEVEIARKYIQKAAQIGLKSSCLRSRCGTVIVKTNQIIGTGFNSPPLDRHPEVCRKDSLPINFKSDKTCCVHAEQRAIMEALRKNPDKVKGSRLYFIRIDEKGEIKKSGQPYCTICSKMALDVGIAEFVLWHEEGICVYDTEEYNELSFQYRE
jgi:deoxycytidylate deaminase